MAVSRYDEEYLSPEDQGRIGELTDRARAGELSWEDAHRAAESIRSGYGYSGGQRGDEYKPTGSGGSKADPYAGTNYAQDMIDYAREYAKQASSGGAGDWGAVIKAMEQRDQKVSAIGTDYGKSSNDLLQELYDLYYAPYQNQKPAYEGSQWDSVLDRAANQLIGMNYEDWTKGDQYKALAERYGLQGRMTMQDVLGQISSRTGGLASSYATTAAQQQYNDYMAQLEEVARQMYSGERSDLLENAQLAQGLADRDYNRYQDSLNQYYNERDYQYQLGRDDVNDSRYDQQYADSQKQYADGLAATNKSDAQARINAYLAAYGSVKDLDANLIATSGYTQAELSALEQYYANQKAQEAAAAAAKKSSGSSGGGTTGAKKPTLTAAQTLSALESGIVNDTTKAAYEYYYGQPYEDEGAESETGTKKPANADKGTSYSSIWSRARTMFDQGKTTDEIMKFLDQFSETQLTDAGLDYIMRSLNLGGYRTGG